MPPALWLGYAARYDRTALWSGKRLILRQISSQDVPSIIGATENRRFTDFCAFSFCSNTIVAFGPNCCANILNARLTPRLRDFPTLQP